MHVARRRRQRRKIAQRKQRGGAGFGPSLMIRPKLVKRRRKQKGGILPLAAAVPALMAVGKAVGLGAAGGAAGYGAKKAMDAVFKKRRR